MKTPQNKDQLKISSEDKQTNILCCACFTPLLSPLAPVCSCCNRHQGKYLRYLPSITSMITIAGVIVSILLVILAFMQYEQSSKEHIKASDAVRIAEESVRLADESQKRSNKTEQKLTSLKSDMLISVNELNSLKKDYKTTLAVLQQDGARLNANLAHLQFGMAETLHRTMPKSKYLEQLSNTLIMKSLEEIEKADCRLLSLKDGKEWSLGDDCSAEQSRSDSTGRR